LELITTQKLSLRKAARIVARETKLRPECVLKRYQRSQKKKSKRHGNQALTDQQEKALVAGIIALYRSGIPVTTKFVCGWASDAFRKNGKPFSKYWGFKFVKRHKAELKHGKRSPIDLRRLTSATVDSVEGFLKCYEEELSKIPPDRLDLIINADESGIAPGPQHDTRVITARADPNGGPLLIPVDTVKTVLPFVTAAGTVLMVVLIFANVHKSDQKNCTPIYVDDSRGTRDRPLFPVLYASTENGYVTSELWLDCCRVLGEIIKSTRGEHEALLLFDRHAAHLKLQSLLKLHEYGIRGMIVPPHLTHLLQPLDDVPFANFKAKMAHLRAAAVCSMILARTKPKQVYQRTVVQAFMESFTPNVIKAAWNNTGLWPYDRNKILQKITKTAEPTPDVLPTSSQMDSLDELSSAFIDRVGLNQPFMTNRRSSLSEKNKLYTTDQLVEFEEAKEAERQEKETQKQEREKHRLELKQRKEELRAERQRNKTANGRKSKNRCNICNSFSREKLNWWYCILCNQFNICEQHIPNELLILAHLEGCSGNE
jgi:hypothetical protein